jgi:hypothetical protein
LAEFFEPVFDNVDSTNRCHRGLIRGHDHEETLAIGRLLRGAGMLAGLPKFSAGETRQRGSSPRLQF